MMGKVDERHWLEGHAGMEKLGYSNISKVRLTGNFIINCKGRDCEAKGIDLRCFVNIPLG